jgi:hypothetical protein
MTAKIKTESDMRAMVKNEACITVMTAVFEAMAFCETIRSIVEPKQQEIVSLYKFKVRDEFKERRGIEVIEFPKHMYLADESDWKLYDNEMIAFYKEQNLKHKEGCCPLLEAESLVREVKRHAVGILEPFTGISWDNVCWNLKNYEKYMDLMLTLFAPVVKSKLK